MKKPIFILVIALFSCENQHKPTEVSAISERESDMRISYEGRIPLDDHTSLYIELSMLPSGPIGEGT